MQSQSDGREGKEMRQGRTGSMSSWHVTVLAPDYDGICVHTSTTTTTESQSQMFSRCTCSATQNDFRQTRQKHHAAKQSLGGGGKGVYLPTPVSVVQGQAPMGRELTCIYVLFYLTLLKATEKVRAHGL